MSKFFHCENPKFVFIHIPKTGGSSLKSIISSKCNIKGFKVDGELITWHGKSHSKFTKIDKQTYDNYFKFTFVRHPYNWIKSYYNFHKNKDKFYKKATGIKVAMNFNYKTFDDYLNYLLKNPMNQTDYFISNGEILVDHVARLESFDKEIEFIFEKLNLDNEFELKWLKKSSVYNIDEVQELTIEQKNKIQLICDKDFDILKYEK